MILVEDLVNKKIKQDLEIKNMNSLFIHLRSGQAKMMDQQTKIIRSIGRLEGSK